MGLGEGLADSVRGRFAVAADLRIEVMDGCDGVLRGNDRKPVTGEAAAEGGFGEDEVERFRVSDPELAGLWVGCDGEEVGAEAGNRGGDGRRGACADGDEIMISDLPCNAWVGGWDDQSRAGRWRQ